ncbi:hypothetical protein GCM10025791_31650 [Halioxenophilus aromaticivorans]|uniref:Uncharacterized protein n=2 Tax=Halioxenophilus aromaticivorans TaxID=1306992 RepID=A0AAV3U5G6_9ALTE
MFRSGDLYWVPAGAIAGLAGAEIKIHIFVANKADWDTIGGDGVQHEGFYPVYEDQQECEHASAINSSFTSFSGITQQHKSRQLF